MQDINDRFFEINKDKEDDLFKRTSMKETFNNELDSDALSPDQENSSQGGEVMLDEGDHDVDDEQLNPDFDETRIGVDFPLIRADLGRYVLCILDFLLDVLMVKLTVNFFIRNDCYFMIF